MSGPTVALSFLYGYTIGMKTAISLPDELFDEADELARRMNKSRSQMYAEALAEYVNRHSTAAVTEKMNELCDELGPESDGFASEVARRTLEKVEW